MTRGLQPQQATLTISPPSWTPQAQPACTEELEPYVADFPACLARNRFHAARRSSERVQCQLYAV